MSLNKLNQSLVTVLLLTIIFSLATWMFQQLHASSEKEESKNLALREKFYWECFSREYKKDRSGGVEKNEQVSVFCSREADEYLKSL